MDPDPQHLGAQVVCALVVSAAVACIAWTVTREEVFREMRDYCKRRSAHCRRLVERKFFYLFTCEYCFSHWVALALIAICRFRLLLPDWRGYVLSFFTVVFIANAYMSLFARLRVDIRSERAAADLRELEKRRRAMGDSANGRDHQPSAPPSSRDLNDHMPTDSAKVQ